MLAVSAETGQEAKYVNFPFNSRPEHLTSFNLMQLINVEGVVKDVPDRGAATVL